MKQWFVYVVIMMVSLVSCRDNESLSSVTSHFGIDGVVNNVSGSALSDIELILTHEGTPIDTTYSASDGSFWFGGDAHGESLFWIYARDIDEAGVQYAPDSVRVVLDYRGGNGRSNLGNGTATVNLILQVAP